MTVAVHPGMGIVVRPRDMSRFGAAMMIVASLLGAPSNAAVSLAAQAVVDRVTWGASAPAMSGPDSPGSDPWLERQLHPVADIGLPPVIQAGIDDMTISKRSMADIVVDMDAQNKATNIVVDPVQKLAARAAYGKQFDEIARQAMHRSLLRDIYAPAQLREQMTWFWVNHFSVFLGKGYIRAMIADYEDEAIRPHAFGRYRDLLEATLRHPAMLTYLDNWKNAAGLINENYAREIMELHSMGVGSGYTQKDVQELARILTGVGLDLNHEDPKLKPALQPLYIRAGLFEFNPARHDFGDKIFMGHTIKGSGFAEVEQALDLIAASPATAHHVSSRLAETFVGEQASPKLVDAMAATFRRSDGDIGAVLKTMFRSPEFRRSTGTAFKDPMHYVLSAVRMAYGDREIVNVQPLADWLERLGQPLYGRQTPDGYPLEAAAWSSPGQMAARFEFARQLGGGQIPLFAIPDSAVKPSPVVPKIKDSPLYAAIEPRLSAQTKAALAQAATPQEWNILFLASPEFMRR